MAKKVKFPWAQIIGGIFIAVLVAGVGVVLFQDYLEKETVPTLPPATPPAEGSRQFKNIEEVYNAVMLDGYQINDWAIKPYEWRYDKTASPSQASTELQIVFFLKDPRLFDAPLSDEYFSVGDVVHKAYNEGEYVLSKVANTSGYTTVMSTENWRKMIGYLHQANQNHFYMLYTEDEWITYNPSGGLSYWWKVFKVDAIEIINRCGGTSAAGTAGTYDDINFGRWDDPVTSVNVIPADDDITQTSASNTTTTLTVPLTVDDTKGDWQIRPDEKILFYTYWSGGTTTGDTITGASIAGNTITLQPFTSGSTTYYYGFIPLGSLKTGNLCITASFGTANADEVSAWYIIGGAKCANTGGTVLDEGWIWVDKVKTDLGLSGTPVVNFAQWYNPTVATYRGTTFVDGTTADQAEWDSS